ncbi:MAG TPA: hypothetical protein VNA20_02355 [Frankiaceae bacterium]|nr:hypothetical protein [Frankiaceae bacterium]
MKRVLAGVALAVVAAGCSGSSGGPGVATLSGRDATPTPTASADPEEAFRKFAKCMRENGVDMPDPGRPGAGAVVLAPTAAPQRVRVAEEKCAPFLEGVVAEGPRPDDPAMQDRALKFARCMREKGIDMPDPGTDGAIRKRVGGDDVAPPFDPADPKFKAAHDACGGLLGAGGPGGLSVEVAGP